MYGRYNVMSHKGSGAQGFSHAFSNINYQRHCTQYMLHHTQHAQNASTVTAKSSVQKTTAPKTETVKNVHSNVYNCKSWKHTEATRTFTMRDFRLSRR
jgi:hypothetical protein